LCDGVAIGEVFQSPSADQIVAVADATHSDAGVLFLFGNYSGKEVLATPVPVLD